MSKIKSISFLIEDQRIVVSADEKGEFSLPVIKTSRGHHKTFYHGHTAKQVAEHAKIKSGDPVLTMQSGEKIRVYQGGEGSYMIAIAAAAIEIHDKSSRQEEAKKKKTDYSSLDNCNSAGQFEFPWDDLGEWD